MWEGNAVNDNICAASGGEKIRKGYTIGKWRTLGSKREMKMWYKYRNHPEYDTLFTPPPGYVEIQKKIFFFSFFFSLLFNKIFVSFMENINTTKTWWKKCSLVLINNPLCYHKKKGGILFSGVPGRYPTSTKKKRKKKKTAVTAVWSYTVCRNNPVEFWKHTHTNITIACVSSAMSKRGKMTATPPRWFGTAWCHAYEFLI